MLACKSGLVAKLVISVIVLLFVVKMLQYSSCDMWNYVSFHVLSLCALETLLHEAYCVTLVRSGERPCLSTVERVA